MDNVSYRFDISVSNVMIFCVRAYKNTIFDWTDNFKTLHCPNKFDFYGQY